MGTKYKVWLDSGANAFSCREVEISIEELGWTQNQWDKLDEETKSDILRDIAFDRSEWGYTEI